MTFYNIGVRFQDYVQRGFAPHENIILFDLSRSYDTDAIYRTCAQGRTDYYIKEWENGHIVERAVTA